MSVTTIDVERAHSNKMREKRSSPITCEQQQSRENGTQRNHTANSLCCMSVTFNIFPVDHFTNICLPVMRFNCYTTEIEKVGVCPWRPY